MSRTRFRFIALFLAFGIASTMTVKTQAQDAKRFVISTPAGSSPDRIARSLATQADLKSAWAAYIGIDNQPGAFGLTAVEYMRKLPADGSALLIVTVRESGVPTADYAPSIAGLADFVPIAYLRGITLPNGKSWFGVFGPPGMPRASARRLEAAIEQAMRSTELTTVLASTSSQQDRPVSAVALAQAVRASTLAAGAVGATAGAGGTQQPGNANAAADDPKVIGGVFRP